MVLLNSTMCEALNRRDRALLPNLEVLRISGYGLLYVHTHGIDLLEYYRTWNTQPNRFMLLVPLVNVLTILAHDAPCLKTLHMRQHERWYNAYTLVFDEFQNSLMCGLNLEEFICEWLPLSKQATYMFVSMPALRCLTINTDIHDLVQIFSSRLANESAPNQHS